MTDHVPATTAAAILAGWYAGEVGGEALFWRLAELAEPSPARKWLALASVEGRIAERLLHVLVTHDLPVPATESSLEWARSRAEANAPRPWHEQMQWLGEIAREALAAMRLGTATLAPEFAVIGALVVAHEELLVEFARAELAGNAAGSVALIEQFLGTTPRP